MSTSYSEMRTALMASMPGFGGLVEFVQGFMIGHCLATNEIIETPDVATTRAVVRGLWAEAHHAVNVWGIEQ